MGKALYRTHRSKSFDEVIGQSHITDTLKNALSKGSVAHAYLFTGPRGVGKTSIARILAHAINDLPYTDESTHLDIIEIDAASNRRIDEIRELRDKVHIAPTSAKYKVYIIDEVHMLTREAFNALLKTLEEPPEHVVFILATTEAHKIPDTIISRTQKFTFKPIDTETAISHLKNIAKQEGILVDDTALKLIAQHGNGSFRDSISMLDQLSGLAKESYGAEDVSLLLGLPNDEVIRELLRSLATNDSDLLFSAVRTMREQGIDAAEAAKAVSAQLREQIIQKSLQLPQERTMLLLKELLPLTAGNADYSAFELCLLGAINLGGQSASIPIPQARPTVNPVLVAESPKPTDTAGPNQNEEKSAQQGQSHTKSEPPSRTVEATAASDEIVQPIIDNENEQAEAGDTAHEAAPFSPETWQGLLDDLKSHHNTLYGVLRMAHASLDDGKLLLRFSYGFHKKRIDAPQNSSIIRTFLKKHFGNAEFVTTVSKDQISQTSQTSQNAQSVTAPKPASVEPPVDISSVSNIFGGAELLES